MLCHALTNLYRRGRWWPINIYNLTTEQKMKRKICYLTHLYSFYFKPDNYTAENYTNNINYHSLSPTDDRQTTQPINNMLTLP
jgi:hypothetical protein